MPTETLTFTKREALDVLVDAGSHAYLTADAGTAIAKAFGLDIQPEKRTNQPGEFKGLSVPGKKIGESVEGHSGWVLAERIARHLLPSWGCHAEGRGTRFRHAVLEIEKHVA